MKDHIFTRFWLLLALLPLLAVLQGCPGNDDPPIKDEEAEKIAADPDYKAKDYLRKEYMDVYYYWRDQVKSRNANFKPYDYDIYDFFDIMLYQKDRWSWMCDKEYYVSSETGVYTGTWGVSLDQAVEMGDYSIYIRYIYPGSPFEQYGVTRGAKITHINGVNVMDDESGFTREKLNYFNENYNKSPQTFTFRLADGRDTTFTAQKAMSLSTHPVLITRVYQPDEFPGLAEPVGYFHYLSFLGSEVFLEEIDNAMKTLHDAGVKKAIIDLRYNGGGDSRASQRLRLSGAEVGGREDLCGAQAQQLRRFRHGHVQRYNRIQQIFVRRRGQDEGNLLGQGLSEPARPRRYLLHYRRRYGFGQRNGDERPAAFHGRQAADGG